MDLCEMVCLCFASACDEEMMLKASLVQVGIVNSYKGFESESGEHFCAQHVRMHRYKYFTRGGKKLRNIIANVTSWMCYILCQLF